MDSIVFEETVNTEVSQSEFVDKQWLYVNDNNNGSYSSQVVLDTTPLANSGAYINWQEALILMPLILQFKSSSAALTDVAPADYVAALKSGYWNMLHSMSVEFNNGNVIQQVPFMNVFCSFKNITSWSRNDLTNWGAVCGFAPDSSRSWAYLASVPANTDVLSGSGSGLSNNRNAPYVTISLLGTAPNVNAYNTLTRATQASVDIRQAWNEGLFERQNYFNYDPVLSASNAFSSNQGAIMSDANCSSVFRSYVNALANNRWIAIDAVIRLKDIADFFQKCPMLKGSTMRIYLNTNQCYFQVTQTSGVYNSATGALSAQPILALNSAPVILGGGGTNPILYASNGLGQGSSVITPFVATTATTAVVEVAVSIVRTQFSQFTSTNSYTAPYTSVRLYAPAYTLSPLSEQRLLSLTPTKRVEYNDIFQFSFPSQPIGSNFNILVSNGIPNLRSVLVVAMLPQASNGPLAGAVTSSSILSPFCSTPSSPDPLIIQNFQIQISGKNLFNTQLQYDYEAFVEQLVSSNQLNGSLTTSLSSGLISKQDFQSLYRYYYGNCSRSLPSEEGVAKAVQIQGQILGGSALANKVCDLMVFCEFSREIVIDLRTGARLS